MTQFGANVVAGPVRLLYDGFMNETSSSTTHDVSSGRRTVLLALGWESEILKRGIYDHVRRAGWSVLDLRFHGMEIPRSFRADGVLFLLAGQATPLVRRFLRMGVPVVQIDDAVLPGRCCCVVQDRWDIGKAAAEHFAQRGFRNMAYLHSEEFDTSPFKPTGLSFVQHARGLGAKADLFAIQRLGRVTPWARFEVLARRFGREIAKFELPLGIFTYNDVMAVRICRFCDAIGLRVPEEVAVLGNGNDPYKCEYAPTPLSSVDPNHFGQGQVAAELLDRLMDGEPTPADPVLIAPAGVVTRQSTDVLAMPDADTAMALRYMWEHLDKPVGVPDIAEACGMSRSKLERHLRKHLGRSVTEELVRKRLERGCEMLRATELSINEIARQVGFKTETYFFRVFRKAMGTTPRKYRLANRAKGGQGDG